MSAPTVTAVVCAYTLERWPLLVAAVRSLRSQTVPPLEVIVCIDHNEGLRARAQAELAAEPRPGQPPVTVIANRFDGRLGSARNTAAEVARGDVLAFLDDDARAEPTWLEHLTAPFADPSVMAVGGAPLPEMGGRKRPGWFPFEFDWVFGCAYTGLPTSLAPARHLIGASMSVRRALLAEIGGFHSDNHDDMDMCHRLAARHSDRRIMFEPAAVVRHHVHPERLTWGYFWRRCFFVNRGKVAAFRAMDEAGNLGAETSFVTRTLTAGVGRELRRLLSGDPAAVARIVTMTLGILLAGTGYCVGTLEHVAGRRPAGQGSGS